MTPDSLRYAACPLDQRRGEVRGPDAPQIVRIEVEPSEQILLAKENRQLRVWAVDEAGVKHCVTTEAEYESKCFGDRGASTAAASFKPETCPARRRSSLAISATSPSAG